MSEYDEMGDFIVDDPNVATAESGSESEPENDRILQMTSQLKPNQTQQQKLLKAHISVLVSALGGPDHTSTVSPAPYKLGHDALACLKDIKKWIKEVDERKGGYEVAIACADSGLITNDIIHILCQWDSNLSSKVVLTNSKYMEKIMLSSLELLVLLTWPVELTPEMTPNQKLLYPDVKKVQLVYKKHLLGFNNGQTIRAVIRLVLPSISKNKADREPRDHSILRLVLFFLRNVLYIEPANSSLSTKSSKQVISADNLPAGVSYDDISMSAVLVAYKKNKALMLLLTILGSLGADFDRSFAVICLECVYLLVNRVDSAAANDSAKYSTGKSQPPRQSKSDATHSNEQGVSSSSGAVHTSTDPIDISATAPLASITTTAGMHLKDLLDTEAQRKRAQTKTLQTRHGRFGSLISIRANDSTSYVVSGQEALHSTGSTLDKLDKTKKWNDRAHFKYDSDEFVARPQYLNESGRQVFYEFVEQFLTGGCFNNLVESISAHMSSVNDLEVIEEYEKASYFLTISWFFNYKRLKKEDLNFGSVGAALSEINFILIISYLRQSYTSRKWSSLHVALICFNELLLVSHSLFNKRLDIEDEQHDIDRELAEGIIRKLFSYTDFISLIVQIPQTASKHSPDYLRVCISVVNIILKSFESFANEDIKLYVQTKRKSKSKKKLNNLDPLRDVIEMDSDDEEIEERMQQVKRERRLDFNASEGRFFHSSIVSTHIEYLSRYEDLSFEEIKRCISYFHRLFVVRSDFGGLYRLDFMHTIYKLRNYLPRGTSIRKHVDEFLYYFMKKFKVAFSRFPLPLEILFPRFEDTESRTFLSTGELYIKPESKQGSGPKLAKEVEFVREFTLDEQIKILVSALHEQEKQTLVEWFLEEVFRILKERTMEEGIVCQLNPTPQFKRLLINNSYIRFLMRIIGFDLPYIMDDQILLPSTVALDTLSSCHDLIKKWHSSQPVTFEDGKDASYFLRNREPVFEAHESDIEYNGEYDEDDESIAFVATGDNVTHNAEELDKLEEMERLLENSGRSLGLEKGKAKKKMKEFAKDKTKEARKEKPKRSKKIRSRGPPRTFNVSEDERETPIKSAEFIHDSDDESDSEKANTFFEREERLRQLLSDSGGIINAEQLAEFKKVWSNLERSSGKSASIVAKAVEETSLFVNEEDDDYDDVIPAPSVLLSKDIIEDDSDEPSSSNEVEADSIAVNRRHISSPLEAASSQESNSEGADSHIGITQLSEGHTLLRKALSDNSDSDDFSSETVSPVAEGASVSKRSRTLQDDSDESEDESFSAPPPAKKKRLIMSDEED